MLILGIDPGPKLHGYALLDVTRSRRTVQAFGHAPTGEVLGMIDVWDHSDPRSPLVAVEWSDRILGGFTDHQRSRSIAAALIATQGEAGILLGRAGPRAMKIAAAAWRLGIVGKSSPSDAQVRAVILRLVEGWPKRSAAGEHACDAAGIALAAFNSRPRPSSG